MVLEIKTACFWKAVSGILIIQFLAPSTFTQKCPLQLIKLSTYILNMTFFCIL